MTLSTSITDNAGFVKFDFSLTPAHFLTTRLSTSRYYGENNVAMNVADGILREALTVDFTRSFYDTTQCATFTEITAATHPHPYVIHTRMEATAEGKVTVMESVVTDADDWVFGAPWMTFLTSSRIRL